MSKHYSDRKLVKEPKSIRFDAYQQQFIEAIANWQGCDFSVAVRELVEEAINNRLEAITASQRKDTHNETI